jgi:hypothetical protein
LDGTIEQQSATKDKARRTAVNQAKNGGMPEDDRKASL